MKLYLIFFLVVSVSAFSAQPLAPGIYTGPSTARRVWKNHWLTLTVATNGSATATLRKVSPVTGNILVQDDLGTGINKPNGIVHGGAWGSFSWRGRNLDGTNVSVRLTVQGVAFPAKFELKLVPPPQPRPPSGAVIETQRRILEQQSGTASHLPPTPIGRQW